MESTRQYWTTLELKQDATMQIHYPLVYPLLKAVDACHLNYFIIPLQFILLSLYNLLSCTSKAVLCQQTLSVLQCLCYSL